MKLITLFIPALLWCANLAGQTPLTLEDSWNLALKGNQPLQVAKLDQQAATLRLQEQRAVLLPSVSAGANYTIFGERPVIFLRNEGATKTVNGTEVGGRTAFQAAVTGTLRLLDPVQRSNIRLAQVEAQLEVVRTSTQTQKLLTDVARTYYTIRLHQEHLGLLRQSLLRNQTALRGARLLLINGKGLKTDTLRSYIDVQNLQADSSALSNEIAVQWLYLRQLASIPKDSSFRLTEPLDFPSGQAVIPGIDSLFAVARQNRPELKEQSLKKDWDHEAMRRAVAERRPTLQAIAQYQVQAQADKIAIWSDGLPRTSFAGLQLNLPLYTGKRTSLRIRQADIRMQQGAIVHEEFERSIRKELQILLLQLKETHVQLGIRDKNVEIAQVHFEMMEERFRHGLATRLELADAEVTLTNARIFRLQSLYQLNVLSVMLKQATGELGAK